MKIHNCFDSHVHWLPTGRNHSQLSLRDLRSLKDLSQLQVHPDHFRGEWLTGFGWDQNLWTEGDFPTRFDLDIYFKDHPVAFSRVDGHALWLNTRALVKIGLLNSDGKATTLSQESILGGEVLKDAQGNPSGVLVDQATQKVWTQLPEFSPKQVRSHLKEGARVFNQAGFTHIRDMFCSSLQWEQACALFDAQELTLAVEQFFGHPSPEHFESLLELAIKARSETRDLLRIGGIKTFVDGALGSEGAWLSQPYAHHSKEEAHCGAALLDEERLLEIMIKTWENNFDLALHVIGDQAADFAVKVANRVWSQGLVGRLHLEHAQMLSPQTIQNMKRKNIVCHMQPSHFLSDQSWLLQKVGNLYSYCFPWFELQKSGVPIFLGSDSPVESPSVSKHFESFKAAEATGILAPQWDVSMISKPDMSWTPNTFTEYEEGVIKKVVFQQREVV